MSSIGIIGSFGSGTDQTSPWIQGIARSGSQQIGKLPEGSENPQNRMLERIGSLAQDAGLDSDTIASLKEDLQYAISAAIARANETNGSSDPRQAVHSAVQSTLEKYGIEASPIPDKRGGDQEFLKNQVDSLAKDAGLDSDAIASLHDELQKTISDTIAQAKESADENDPHQAVHAAVQTVLEKYGIDATQLNPPSRNLGFNTAGRPSENQNFASFIGKQYGASSDSGQDVAGSLLELLQIVDETA